MTEKQWVKVKLRVNQLLKEKGGVVQFVLVQKLDGTIQIQVVGGNTETIN
jgi:hypothetical protein